MTDNPAKLRIAISGASGFLGTAISRSLQDHGHEVVKLVRQPPQKPDEVFWDPYKSQIDFDSLGHIDAVINLSGAGIGDRRWTRKYKQTLIESRTVTTRFLAETIASMPVKPRVLISGSAIGYYGNRRDDPLTEDEPSGDDFAAQLCLRWEQAATPAVEANIRTVHPRMGLVIAKRGGIIKKMTLPFRLGLGATLGGGRGWYAWVSLVDVCRAFHKFIEDDSLSGAVNLVGPNPVRGKQFMAEIARAFGRKVHLNVPAIALKLLLGSEMAGSFLGSQKAMPSKLTRAGFSFEHSELSQAIDHYFSKTKAVNGKGG